MLKCHSESTIPTAPSTLTLHVLHPSALLPLLTQTSFSPSLTHIISHPPILLAHLSTAYLTPPPPSSTPEKFWGIFIPISERGYESEKLVFGSGGEGPGGGEKGEFVVEVLVRGGGEGRRKAVERVLEGWSGLKGGPCELMSLDSLKSIWTRKVVEEVGTFISTQFAFQVLIYTCREGRTLHRMYHLILISRHLNNNPELKFLSLTPTKVNSPALHLGLSLTITPGKPLEMQKTPAAILYDPDSADDIDDDDPDEDLDI